MVDHSYIPVNLRTRHRQGLRLHHHYSDLKVGPIRTAIPIHQGVDRYRNPNHLVEC